MESNKPTIAQGTISFWVNHSILVNGDKELVSADPEGGSILVYIENSHLKVTLIVFGKGRTDLSYPTSEISSEDQKHMVVLSWDLATRRLALYLDGRPVASEEISTIQEQDVL